MPSPLHDANHLALARKIQDPVATASTDGQYTSLYRNDLLNRANKMIQLVLRSLGKEAINRHLNGLRATQAITWTSGGVSLAVDYSYFIECQKDGTPPVVLTPYHSKMELDAASNPTVPNAFVIQGGKIYGYQNGVILNAGAGTLYYIKTDARASANDTNDIAIDSLWYDSIVDIAASFYFEERGDLSSAKAQLQRFVIVKGAIGE
jgi:hypothetical protein